MSCMSCFNLCQIFKGNPAQRVGVVSELSADVFVFITNVGSGRTEVQDVLTDGAGNVDLDFTAEYLENGQSYMIQISPNVYASNLLDITPPTGSEAYSCLTFTISNIC